MITRVLIDKGENKRFLIPVDLELEQNKLEKGPDVYFNCVYKIFSYIHAKVIKSVQELSITADKWLMMNRPLVANAN